MAFELDTPDKLEYHFYPARDGQFNFKIRSPNDAHIALSTVSSETDPIVEVFIGGWGNTKSVIRRNRTKPDRVEVPTPGILDAGEFRGFWVRWYNGTITVGREGDAAAFMTWDDPEPFPIQYVGVCTGWGAAGTWKIESGPAAGGWVPPQTGVGAITWVQAQDGQVPPMAIPAGHDGEPVFVARARHEGSLTPGKMVPSHKVAYVSWGGGEHAHDTYEVMCGGSGNWIRVDDGQVPPQALPAGETEEGEPLFIGRVSHDGCITPGKVQPSHGKCYIPYGGQELGFELFEVFVPN